MTSAIFFQGLPDFDSPTLEEEMEAILVSDKENLAKLSLLLIEFNWHEKMAVGLTAYFFIDTTHHRLLKLAPVHDELSVPVRKAMEFLEKLSPQALAELAADILQEDFEGEENAN